jgi:hypothetical protein
VEPVATKLDLEHQTGSPEATTVQLVARTMAPAPTIESLVSHNEAPVETIVSLVAHTEATETVNVRPVASTEASESVFKATARANVATVTAKSEAAPKLGSTATSTQPLATGPAAHEHWPEEPASVSVHSRTVTRTHATRSARRVFGR